MKKVAIMMGSKNDFPTFKPALEILEKFGISYEVRVLSAHRATAVVVEYVSGLRERGFSAVIAGAGMAAHLPGVVAALTPLPVVGLPISGGALNGVDALYAIVQMPKGIPVATVAINGAANAAILAVQILSVADSALMDMVVAYKKELTDECLANDAALTEELKKS